MTMTSTVSTAVLLPLVLVLLAPVFPLARPALAFAPTFPNRRGAASPEALLHQQQQQQQHRRPITAWGASALGAPPLKDFDDGRKGDEARNGAGHALRTRRELLATIAAAAATASASTAAAPLPSWAVDVSGLPTEAEAAPSSPPLPPVELKTFLDPEGYFALTVPKRYYTLRRKAKGDLPNEQTGQGRRGSSIFTAGDMAKAEVVAVERFPTRVLLEEAGIDPTGDLTTMNSLGKPDAVAELLNLRRDRDKPGQGRSYVVKDSAVISNDGKDLTFALRAQIDVQKPELLMEQMGVTELFRETVAKATLAGNDGNMMVVFASALSQDMAGPDGAALRETVDSFRALETSGATVK